MKQKAFLNVVGIVDNNSNNGLLPSSGNRHRLIWPDIIRVIALFALVMIHTSAAGFDGRFGARTAYWQICNVYDAFSQFCVPVFVMISGMFLLNPEKEYDIRKLFQTKLLRLVTAYLFWSSFYFIISIIHKRTMGLTHDCIKIYFWSILNGRFHMWFLFMIAGLYIVTPILRVIVKDERITIYYLVLWLVLGTTSMLEMFPVIQKILDLTVNRLNIMLVAGFSGYFVWGYWLSQHQIPPFARKIIYILGLLAALFTAIFNGLAGYLLDKPVTDIYNYLYPNIFLMATAVFVFCQYFFQKKRITPKWEKGITCIGKWSLGIYLVHLFFIEYLNGARLPFFFCHPIASIPVMTIICFLASLASVFFLSKIPVVNKYII